MKRGKDPKDYEVREPAAFRRLCVETASSAYSSTSGAPAAFRRLCVETDVFKDLGGSWIFQPPSGGCVLKQNGNSFQQIADKPAAFRRLCVETAPML